MKRGTQRGLSLVGLIVVLFVVIVVALLAMRLVPAYMEFGTAKSAIESIARDRETASPAEVRRAFDARAAIDDIRAVRATDLDIIREGGQVVISFAYRKEVPLFANVGVYIDFEATSRGQ
jgi:hypothetical protein